VSSRRTAFHPLFGKRQSTVRFFRVRHANRFGIRVVSLTGEAAGTPAVSGVKDLLARDGALIWVDIPECSDEAVELLIDVLGCHPLALRDCMPRNRVPRRRIIRSRVVDRARPRTRSVQTCPSPRARSDNRRHMSYRAQASQSGRQPRGGHYARSTPSGGGWSGPGLLQYARWVLCGSRYSTGHADHLTDRCQCNCIVKA
jgi:hypothetical protein